MTSDLQVRRNTEFHKPEDANNETICWMFALALLRKCEIKLGILRVIPVTFLVLVVACAFFCIHCVVVETGQL